MTQLKFRLQVRWFGVVAFGALGVQVAAASEDASRGGGKNCCEARAGEVADVSKLTVSYVSFEGAPPSSRRQRNRAMPAYKVVSVEKGGVLEGVVTFEGAKPGDKTLNIVKDHETCDKGPKTRAAVVTDDKNRVQNAVVYLFDIKEGADFPKRDKPPVINQEHCNFEPHVMAVKAGEEVEILNSDPVAHNINASQRIYTLFNVLQPQKDMRAKQKFDRPGLVNIRCNVHDWMEGWVWVFRHPYNQVTGADGGFKLENIPPGKYQMAVWQEALGEQFFEIEIKAGETTKQDVVLKPAENEKN